MGRNKISARLTGVIAGLSIVLLTAIPGLAQTELWSAAYGGSYNDEGYAGAAWGSGHYAILGSTYSSGAGEFDIALFKIDSDGNTVWSRTYGGADTEYGCDVKATGDGGLILVGSTQSYGAGGRDIYLVRVDSLGDTLWTKTYGGLAHDDGRAVEITPDGGFLICGSTESSGAGYSDLYLIKTDASGVVVWSRTFGGAGGDSGNDVHITLDGGFIAVGSTGSFGEGYSSIYVIRGSAAGDSLWARTYGGTKADFGNAVTGGVDGGYIIAGRTASFGAGFYDAYLVKIDDDGNFAWDKTFGGASNDYGYGIYRAMDGTYMLTGVKEGSPSRKTDVYVIKTDPSGNLIWERTYGGSQTDYGQSLFQEPGQDYLMVGYSYSSTLGGSDIYVIKIQGEATDAPEDEPWLLPEGFALNQNYPNPFNAATNISFSLASRSEVAIEIYNILGQKIYAWENLEFPAGVHSVIWEGTSFDGSPVASGIYLYRLRADEFVEMKKMVLVK